MPFDGTGNFSVVYSWQTDQVNGIDVRADRMDVQEGDIASGLSTCITKDGQQTLTANIPFAGFKITGFGAGSAATDSVNYGQVFNSPIFTTPSALASPAQSDNSTLLATTAYVTQKAFSAALPAQPGGSVVYKLQSTASVAAWAVDKPTLPYSGRTSNTILGTADAGTLIDITSGTFSQTFTAAATLGASWWCYIRNSGTGDITLDPNGAELIDGLTSYIMYPAEVRLVQCDGAAFRTVVLRPFSRTFTASGTFTTPPGYSYFQGLLWGGGGSGAKGSAGISASGGAGGGCNPFLIASGSAPATVTVTIAGVATAQASATTNGNAGGDSTFGTLFTGGGGAGGIQASTAFGNAGTINSSTAGSATYSFTYSGAGAGAGSTTASNVVFGGGAGGWINGGVLNGATTSIFGGNGGVGSLAGVGTAGTAPGGGGGATNTGANSGAGARGEARIWGLI